MEPGNEEMNVSQWKGSSPVRPAPTGSTPLHPISLAAPAVPPAAPPDSGFPTANDEPPILTSLKRRGLDPFRCLAGAVQRWHWWMGAALAGLLLGIIAGFATTETAYSSKVRLVKKQATSAFRAGRLGEAYSPPVLKPATLISAAYSYEALQRVASRCNPPKTVAQIRNSFLLTEEKKTDLLILEVWNTENPRATSDLANIWAEELVNYTRELQASESRDIRIYLQQQIETMDAETARIDREMVQLIQREGMVDAQKEIESYLRSLSGIELEYHNARISLESVDTQIQALRGAIRGQNPGGERLRALRAQYETLRGTYTESNPIVVEAKAAIAQLEEEIKQQNADPNRRDDSFTGTGVGDALYIELVKLENEKKSLVNRTSELEKLLQNGRKEMQAIPEKAMAYQKLADRKTSLINARELIAGRFQEARIFEERAPGYLGILAPATVDEVSTHGRLLKTALLGLLGAFSCGGLALAGVLVLEVVSSRLKTARELELILDMKPAADTAIPPGPGGLGEIWNAWIVPQLHSNAPIAGWSPMPFAAEETLWFDLLERGSRLFPSAVLVDFSEHPVQPGKACFRLTHADNPPPPGMAIFTQSLANRPLDEARALSSAVRRWAASGTFVLVRFSGPAREPLLSAARQLSPVVFVASLGQGTRKSWMAESATLRQTFPGSHRLVVLP